MDRLSAAQARVLGSLIEKQLTTPQQYPLSLNALVAACNQSSNREPVNAHSDNDVVGALEDLKAAKLVRYVLPSHGRSVVRYRQVLEEVLGLDATQLAVLGVLILRGPQTVGELRIRTDRMAELQSLGAVEHELDLLAGREEPMVERLARRPGQKEERWSELLSDAVRLSEEPAGVATHAESIVSESALSVLQSEVAELRSDLAALREAFGELRDSLGG